MIFLFLAFHYLQVLKNQKVKDFEELPNYHSLFIFKVILCFACMVMCTLLLHNVSAENRTFFVLFLYINLRLKIFFCDTFFLHSLLLLVVPFLVIFFLCSRHTEKKTTSKKSKIINYLFL